MTDLAIQQAFDLALQHHQARRLKEAETIYRRILIQQPGHARATHGLGVIALQTGHHNAAVKLLRQTIALDPGFAEAYANLGSAMKDQGHLDEAVVAYHQAIALRNAFPEAHNNLGNALKEKGQLDEAIAAYGNAIGFDFGYAEAHYNLGIALKDMGRLDDAIAAYHRAIAVKPVYSDAYNNLGIALSALGRTSEAIAAYRRAIAIKPDYPETYYNLGIALYEMGQFDGAAAAYRAAITLRRDYAEAYYNLGNALKERGELDGAMAAYRQAITLKPNSARAHSNLGYCLKEIARVDEAVTEYRKAVEIDPDDASIHSNVIYTLHFDPTCDDEAIAEEHRRWNRRHAEPLRDLISKHANDRTPGRRVRIGYVSPHFTAHAEAHFMLPLLRCHDHQDFEIHLYSSVRKPDAATELHQRCADHWNDVATLNDGDLAARVRRDGIDILVDPVMHMDGSRLPMFARKPAPIQLTWLAYPGGTGLETIDYRLSDRFLDPPKPECYQYVEKSIRLPDWWACYDPRSDAAPAQPRPSYWNAPICFGSLNNPCKMNPPTVRLWARVLSSVPRSTLLLLADSEGHRQHLRQQFDDAGIDSSRLAFVGHCHREQYLRIYDRVDVGLDPLPYNGITTTLDALWMGVPVVSLAGRIAAGRAGLGILTILGLPELATRTEDDFVASAIALANDSARQRSLRSTLRSMMKQSPLMDGQRFARNVEAVYRQTWQTWCDAARDSKR
jgi:protein O-GlcNAc transferase